ncbi:hypothetical protein CDIK_0966 [Cucumispora dikerogammari]|nr:hypothetical protein CDIK_0966 [Cucumispora dikerogammari]
MHLKNVLQKTNSLLRSFLTSNYIICEDIENKQRVIKINDMLTSTHALQKIKKTERVLDIKDFISAKEKTWNSLLIPIFELDNKHIKEKIIHIKNFNKINDTELCKDSIVIDNTNQIFIGEDGNVRGFKKKGKLFILNGRKSDKLLLCAFLTLTHNTFFHIEENILQFTNNIDGDTKIVCPTGGVEITFNFSKKSFKSLAKACKIDIACEEESVLVLEKIENYAKEHYFSYDTYVPDNDFGLKLVEGFRKKDNKDILKFDVLDKTIDLVQKDSIDGSEKTRYSRHMNRETSEITENSHTLNQSSTLEPPQKLKYTQLSGESRKPQHSNNTKFTRKTETPFFSNQFPNLEKPETKKTRRKEYPLQPEQPDNFECLLQKASSSNIENSKQAKKHYREELSVQEETPYQSEPPHLYEHLPELLTTIPSKYLPYYEKRPERESHLYAETSDHFDSSRSSEQTLNPEHLLDSHKLWKRRNSNKHQSTTKHNKPIIIYKGADAQQSETSLNTDQPNEPIPMPCKSTSGVSFFLILIIAISIVISILLILYYNRNQEVTEENA